MPWVTENVIYQQPGERLAAISGALAERFARRSEPVELLHVLNPYEASRPADAAIHARTVESITEARSRGPGASLVAVIDSDDYEVAAGFDVVAKVPTAPGPPQVFAVLAAADRTAAPGDYVVFTNMDICLTVDFYSGVGELLAQGADALIINRRTVHDWAPEHPSAALARFDLGENHPGMDCFVFPRKWIAGFATSDAVIGYGHVMRGLLYNMVARAKALVMLTEVGMTYHYGDDRPWLAEPARKAHEANRRAAQQVYDSLAQDPVAGERLSAFVDVVTKYRPDR